MRDSLLDRIMAQVSVYSGRKDGGLATLQDLHEKLRTRQAIVCECCNQNLVYGHAWNCEIVKNYTELFK